MEFLTGNQIDALWLNITELCFFFKSIVVHESKFQNSDTERSNSIHTKIKVTALNSILYIGFLVLRNNLCPICYFI